MRHLFLNKIEKIIESKRDIILTHKHDKIVLYPYGEIGSYVESWLKENLGILPYFYIDNFKANGKQILTLEQAAKRENENFVVLIVSDSVEYYSEIRENLYSTLYNTQIVDLFEEPGTNKVNDLRRELSLNIEETRKCDPVILRKAYALAEYFEKKPIKLSENDILVGRLERIALFNMTPLNIKEVIELCKEKMYPALYNYMLLTEEKGVFCSNMGLHIIPVYDTLLKEGIQKQINKIRLHKAKDISKEQEVIYEAQLIVLCSFQKYILRCAEAVKSYPLSINRENRVYDAINNIAYDVPKSFFEAVQLLLFLHIGVIEEAGSGSISFGRLDRILYPYYKDDIESGNIDKDYAQNIINEFYRKISNMGRSWQNVTLGGSDEFGNDESNELTIMCLNASLAVHADQPQVSLRVNKNMPQEVWNKAFELIKTGRGIPALFNDEVAVKAKMSAGVSKEDAWNYGIVGCVELSACGKEYSHTEGMRINWAKILELMLYGDEYGLLSTQYDLAQFKDFKDFYDALKTELIYVTKQCCEFLECAREEFSKKWPTPFTSCVMDGCIEKGKDITDGGTIYNNMTINAVGVASTVDSLQVIKTLVFDKKLVSLYELKEVLENDFENHSFVYSKIQECDKFGNDIDDVDMKAVDLVQIFTKTIREFETKAADAFQVGYYTSYFHSDFGKLTKALPDGKKNGLPLSSSLSPVSGKDNNGPIAVLNSLNKIDMSEMANGMVLDMKFVRSFFDKEENLFALKTLIQTYFQRGGMEIQFNVVDKKTLIEAQKNPMKYRNLMVRVSGFSSYFVDLDTELQNEIINRTENM